MSHGGFHVHGPHDHEIEHAAGHGGADAFAGRIAVSTAIIATIGALFSYQGGATQANAALYKNNAAIAKTEAANQWAYYQSKSGKQNLAELGAALTGGTLAEQFKAEAARYRKEKADIEPVARRHEEAARDWDEQSARELHLHHRWAQATTALQIAIALAAIALLTRRNWLQWGVYGVAGVGVALGGLALAHV